ncbi:hypothetical protein [Sphingomonas alba]|uniref:DUF2178 domain-containing protein n=1 Tax=Sphingomonas alba TaxID=2908208 RepID=A0ABT0RM66_9SPHN|nr:hypothetical protein [Sphingomonas alba]MCL6683695.1 hypothetical protein [Sphingomonas alba]
MNIAVQDSAQAGRRKQLVLVVALEMVALSAAAVAMIFFDLGWVGAILIALLAGAFTIAIVRVGEGKAKAEGNFSVAMGRYNRRMLVASAVYVVGLFGAIWADELIRPGGPLAFLIGFLPSIGVLVMVVAMARLVAEEEDEYQRSRHIRASLFGLGTLLVLATIWGFFEQFGLVPHVPSWAAVPVFALGLGLANCLPGRRA